MAIADDRSIARLEARLNKARAELASAEQLRDGAGVGSATHSRGTRAVDSAWMRVRRLERELEAVQLANQGR
jgi:hypothetical protein